MSVSMAVKHQLIIVASAPLALLQRQANLHDIYPDKRKLELVLVLMTDCQEALQALTCQEIYMVWFVGLSFEC